MQTNCPRCQCALRVGDGNVGKPVRCPKCQTVFKTGNPSPPTVASPQPPKQPTTPPPVFQPQPSTQGLEIPPSSPNLGSGIPQQGIQPAPPAPQVYSPPSGGIQNQQPTPAGPGFTPGPGFQPDPAQPTHFQNWGAHSQGPFQPIKFMMSVVKDPEKQLRGQFNSELRQGGLFLKQKAESYNIPVGTQVREVANSQIGLPINGREIIFKVTGWRTITGKFNADLVDYLSGEPLQLNERDYLLPWYVFLPALLPFGIPIATLGGALPVLIGIGLGVLCLYFSKQETIPVALRISVSLILSLVGYVGTFLLLIALFGGGLFGGGKDNKKWDQNHQDRNDGDWKEKDKDFKEKDHDVKEKHHDMKDPGPRDQKGAFFGPRHRSPDSPLLPQLLLKTANLKTETLDLLDLPIEPGPPHHVLLRNDKGGIIPKVPKGFFPRKSFCLKPKAGNKEGVFASYNVHIRDRAFHAVVGQTHHPENPPKGKYVFEVDVEGKLQFRSKVLAPNEKQEFYISIVSARFMLLRVELVEGEAEGIYPIWYKAEIIRRSSD